MSLFRQSLDVHPHSFHFDELYLTSNRTFVQIRIWLYHSWVINPWYINLSKSTHFLDRKHTFSSFFSCENFCDFKISMFFLRNLQLSLEFNWIQNSLNLNKLTFFSSSDLHGRGDLVLEGVCWDPIGAFEENCFPVDAEIKAQSGRPDKWLLDKFNCAKIHLQEIFLNHMKTQ